MVFKFLKGLRKPKLIKANLTPQKTKGQYGNVDFIDERGISGWFVNLDNLDDNTLTVKINGKVVGEVKPAIFRPDINQLVGKNIQSGFFASWEELSIPAEALKSNKWKVEVLCKGIPIAGSRLIDEALVKSIIKRVRNKYKVNYINQEIKEDGFIGYVDRIEQLEKNKFIIYGWIAPKNEEKQISSVKLILKTETGLEVEIPLKYPIKREDVMQALGDKSLLNSGFTSVFEINPQDSNKYELFLNILVKNNEETEEVVIPIAELTIFYLPSRWVDCRKLEFTESKNFKKTLPEAVDVIIPVFNSSRFLSELFKSLLENTDEPFRLIVVDDASTDYRVVEFLKELAQKHSEKVKLIRNERNRGFTYSVNRGLKEARGHAVILNSDVVVPPGWLSRLMEPIFRDERVASTTPFTNAGTICSFPEFLKDNELPEGMNLEEIDEVFSSLETKDCEFRLPTAVGFCMGINKKALKEVGLFDEENFPMGYGEENDWCMRAYKKGYKHLLVPNLFVYHKHGGSFSSETKQKLTEKHLKKLNELHPEYEELVREFIEEDPLKEVRNLLALKLFGKKKPTTFVFDHDLGGGANIYREELIKERRKEERFVLLYTEGSVPLGQLKGYYREFEFSAQEPEDFKELLAELNVDEVIVNNLVSYRDPLGVLSAVEKAKDEKNFTLAFPLHDYFALCPSFNLLNAEGVFCGLPEDLSKCDECLKNNPFSELPQVKGIRKWRESWRRFLSRCDKIIGFSNFSKELLLKAYPDLPEEKILVLPHKLGVLLRKVKPKKSTGEFRVGVIGAINYQKGAQVVLDLARKIKEKKLPIKIVVVGYMNVPVPEELKEVIKVLGPYKREELPDIIEREGIEVVFFPSIVPETFSFVLEEVMAMELPVVAFDLGAQGERIKNYEKGKVVKHKNLEEVLKVFEEEKKKWS